MSRVAQYRASMLKRKAEHLGVTVAQMIADGERQLALSHRVYELRSNRRSGWRPISLRAQACGRGWVVLW